MHSKIGLQVLVLVLVFLMWNTLRFKQEALIEQVQERLGAVPVLVVSESESELRAVADSIRGLPLVRRIEVETPADVKSRLLERLEESAGHPLDTSSRELLTSTPLPGMVHVTVHPALFDAAARDSLWSALTVVREDLTIRYNHDFWIQRWDEIGRLQRVQLLYEAFFAALLLLTAVILRLVFENRQDEYWRIVRRAGGDGKRRARLFWKNSLVILLVPAIVSTGSLVGYRWLVSGQLLWPWLTLAMQAGCLLLAVFVSWLALKEKLS